MNLLDHLNQLEVLAGGIGSGRHKEFGVHKAVTKTYDHLIAIAKQEENLRLQLDEDEDAYYAKWKEGDNSREAIDAEKIYLSNKDELRIKLAQVMQSRIDLIEELEPDEDHSGMYSKYEQREYGLIVKRKISAGGVGSGKYLHHKRVPPKQKLDKDGRIIRKDPEAHERKLAEIRRQQQDIRDAQKKSGLSVRGKPIVSDKAKRALLAMKPADRRIQSLSTKCEKSVADAVGGEMFADNRPLDVIVKNKETGKTYGIEVKALIVQTNDKITMKTSAIQRKLAYAKKNKLKSIYTVVVDYRQSETRPTVYYKKGVGSFRVGSMQAVDKGLKGLRDLFK